MDYTIIKHQNLTDMVDHVKACTNEGWEPLGGVALGQEDVFQGGGKFYVQAMTRKGPAFLYEKAPVNTGSPK